MNAKATEQSIPSTSPDEKDASSPAQQMSDLWMKTLRDTASQPLSGGVFMSSTNVIIRAEEILPLYNMMVEADPMMTNQEMRRLRVTVASVLQSQIEDGMLRGHFASSDNRQERRHGL